MEKLGQPGTIILVHGILSSPELTSLRSTEDYYKSKGYNVKYIRYNSLTDSPTSRIIYEANSSKKDGEVIVIGHSLGGRYVSQASKAHRDDNVRYYTVNSPWSTSGDAHNTVDMRHSGDWANILAFFNDPKGLMSSKFTTGGHAVTQEQVV